MFIIYKTFDIRKETFLNAVFVILILIFRHKHKLRFYKTFKLSFCREPYLDSISDFTLRKIITKFLDAVAI